MADKLKITFAPGCFDYFEGTQEELDAMIAEITALFESEDLAEKFAEGKIVYLGENDLTEEEWEHLDEQDAKYLSNSKTLH